MDCSPPDPLSMGSSKQEYWSRFSFPLPGDPLHPGIELCFLCLLHWQTCSLLLVPPGKPNHSIKFHCSVMSNSLWPHELQHARLPCLSPTPGACSNSCLSDQWCHPTISSPVIPFSGPQSFPASGSFSMSQFFLSGGQSIRVSGSASVLPMNIQDWFPLGLTGWISLQSKGLSRVFSNTAVQKHQFYSAQLSL